MAPLDPSRFIADNLRLTPVPALPEISIYSAHPGSGLRRLVGDRGAPPYWAYPWAGGLVLARYVLEHPEVVRGRAVLDLGAGSGIVAIAAATAGAGEVLAAELDPIGRAALALNLEANGVSARIVDSDVTKQPPAPVDLILAGDVFYSATVARRMLKYLDLCLAAGIEVLVGDPRRKHLPLTRLRSIAEYTVPDFGDGAQPASPSAVFALEPAVAAPARMTLR